MTYAPSYVTLLDHVEDHTKFSWLENDCIDATVQMPHDLVEKSAWWCNMLLPRLDELPGAGVGVFACGEYPAAIYPHISNASRKLM